jgi:hypothetical protein
MPPPLSRRRFLKRAGGSLLALGIPSWPGRSYGLPLPPEDTAARTQVQLGRVTTSWLEIHPEPDVNTQATGHRAFDEVVVIRAAVEGPSWSAHNTTWYEIHDGYIHSSWVQPVKRLYQKPLLPSQVDDEHPALLEVSVPYSDAYRLPSQSGWRSFRLYYGSTHWAVGVERDAERRSWYRLRNDRGYGHYYARATHLRPVTPDELAPLSPGVPDKHVEINLSEERLTAYEGDEVVLSTRVATGAVFAGGRDFRTPVGQFRVWRKRASRHMEGGTPSIDYFNLPGVPWVSYFMGGVALHGTYWHNDYGRVRSHGCVNLTPEDAHWLYRWTEPPVPGDEEILDVKAGEGTLVHVSY